MHFYLKKKKTLNIKHNNDHITSWMTKGESSVRLNLSWQIISHGNLHR